MKYHILYSSLDVLCIEAENEQAAKHKAAAQLIFLNKPGWKIEQITPDHDPGGKRVAWTPSDERKRQIEEEQKGEEEA